MLLGGGTLLAESRRHMGGSCPSEAAYARTPGTQFVESRPTHDSKARGARMGGAPPEASPLGAGAGPVRRIVVATLMRGGGCAPHAGRSERWTDHDPSPRVSYPGHKSVTNRQSVSQSVSVISRDSHPVHTRDMAIPCDWLHRIQQLRRSGFILLSGSSWMA